MLSKSLFGLTLAAALLVGNPGRSAEIAAALPERAGVTTELGGHASALTYWVSTAEGWNVVTTIDTVTGDEAASDRAVHAVVRFSSLILPGQSQVISVPEQVGLPARELHIRRLHDRIEVALVPLPAQPDRRNEATN
ncbi:MAG TPA: hypothetical protein VGH36_11210 [Acetobacteraceae bacterium]